MRKQERARRAAFFMHINGLGVKAKRNTAQSRLRENEVEKMPKDPIAFDIRSSSTTSSTSSVSELPE